jgi:hypothetical protein
MEKPRSSNPAGKNKHQQKISSFREEPFSQRAAWRLTVVLRANALAEMLPISQTRAQMLGLIFAFHHLTVLRFARPGWPGFRWLAGI